MLSPISLLTLACLAVWVSLVLLFLIMLFSSSPLSSSPILYPQPTPYATSPRISCVPWRRRAAHVPASAAGCNVLTCAASASGPELPCAVREVGVCRTGRNAGGSGLRETPPPALSREGPGDMATWVGKVPYGSRCPTEGSTLTASEEQSCGETLWFMVPPKHLWRPRRGPHAYQC